MIGALLLASGIAAAQEPTTTSGSVSVGVVGSDIDGEEARFQRYRDLRGGADGGFRLDFHNADWFVNLAGDSVGRRNQRYFGELEQPGKLTVSFEWDEVPLFYSERTRTLYSETSAGVLRIDDGIQAGLEDRSLAIADVMTGFGPFDTRTGRDSAAFHLEYIATPELDFDVRLKTTQRNGLQPWAASFAFSQMIEVPVPLDHRTTDLNIGMEWGNQHRLLRLQYDGSWFDNDIQTLVWDNPFKTTDSTNSRAYATNDGTSQGRMALWPSNTSHTVSATGSMTLPGRSRLTGTVAVGARDQNEPLLPHTINTAIEPIPLDRATAEAEVRTLATNLAFTSRPNRWVGFQARYRYYDYDNRTPPFDAEEYVRFDQVLEEGGGHSHGFSVKRQDFDADVSFSPLSFTSFKLGYGYGRADRTFRIFPQTDEHTFRASFDSLGHRYFSLRTKYEYSRREGDDFDVEALEHAGEQPGMRHFDVANRDRQRVTTMVTLTPLDFFSVNFSVAAGKDDFDDSEFGLLDNEHQIYTVGFDAYPRDEVGFGLYYAYENYTALQQSRNTSSIASSNPTQNWTTDSDDTVHTIGGNLDVVEIVPKTDVHFGYDFTTSESLYVYAVESGLSAPSQLDPVKNELHRVTVDATYSLTERLALGLVYWFDKYLVEDFALGGSTGVTPPSGLLLGHFYEPYTVHTGWLRLIYSW